MFRLERGARFIQLYPTIRGFTELGGRRTSQARRGKQKVSQFANNRERDAAMQARADELVAQGWVIVQRP